jgi:hypothetical protein
MDVPCIPRSATRDRTLGVRSRRAVAAVLGVTLVGLGLCAPGSAVAQGRCSSDVSRAGTFGAGAADSPKLPGTVLVRFGGRFPCPDDAEWWFEYGTTPQYGQHTTAENDTVEDFGENGAVTVRADVDGLAYNQTYHYRLVVRYPDGAIETGADNVVRMRPGALRPPQRVGLRWSERPSPAGTHLDTLSVLDALPGSKVTVSCTGDRCNAPQQKLVLNRRPTVFRDWRVQPPDALRVVVAGRGIPTVTTIRPRPHRGPVLETECGGFPVEVGAIPCPAVSLTHRGADVGRFAITDVTRGSTVQIICRGDGCPPSDFTKRVTASKDEPFVDIRPRGYGALRPGATLHVFITRPKTFGLAVRFRVTRESVDRSPYRCLSPNVPLRRVACPTAPSVSTGRGTASASALTVPFSNVAKGANGPARARNLAIHGERRWRALWDRLGESGEPPVIDFDREMVIAVLLGRAPSGGHAIRVERIEDRHHRLLVRVVKTRPGRGCPAAGVVTTPYHVVRLRRSARPVRFERRTIERACR